MALDERERTDRLATRYPIARREPLAHPVRRGILDAVRVRPGRSARELADALGSDVKTVMHHASVLAAHGCIDVRKEGGRRWIFPREGASAPKRVLAAGEAAAKVLAHALERPGCTAGEICGALGVSITSTRFQLRRLVSRGLLVEAGAGYAVAPRERDAVRAGLGLRGSAAR